MQTNTYLNFDGTTEEAFRFYAKAFGTEPEGLTRYKDMPMEGVELSARDAEKLMHVTLPIGDGCVLMGSDPLAAFGHKVEVGNNAYTNLVVDSRKEVDRLFSALSGGGKVEMAPADMPWGDYWCGFRDRYGVGWMITHHPEG